MSFRIHWHNRTGLLVSVRNATEALEALAGGADVIDVKEPARGALGPADQSVVVNVVGAVAGRAPVTAACGELVDLLRHDAPASDRMIPRGVALFKIGLAGCRENALWPAQWCMAIRRLADNAATGGARPVAVVYADWRAAAAPPPNDVFARAVEVGCPALLVDTWEKSCGSLFDHWRADQLAAFVQKVRAQGIAVVLAGSLGVDAISTAVGLRPDLVAVRAAACEGGRNDAVAKRRVHTLQLAIAAAMGEQMPAAPPQYCPLAAPPNADQLPKFFARKG